MMMRRGIFVACFVCSTFGAAVAATDGPVTLDFTPFGAQHAASGSTQLAPADTSFGQYPMSVSGIENAIRRYNGTTQLDNGPIAYAIVAIRDWETRFPRDPWIARALLYMQRVYEHAGTGEGLSYARRVALWVQTDYPATEYAKLSGTELAKTAEGAPEAAAPHVAVAAHVAQPPAHVEKATPAPRASDVWSRFPPFAVPTPAPADDSSR